ncbi:MAG TPA: glutamate formimidoyltransferase [Candidatus Limnocylindrales bacterium]|jgi:glutamate formiminotransferase / 5-formyltetrahydrofolate cyclo-ligase|nr:glutamate formimidoyltransferase [Candidatus Limnocylindrales bacterium]
MDRLVECVPNFSEGRRGEVVDALAQAVESVAGVQLLDRTSDADHNRSVLTFAGSPAAVAEAAQRAVAVAIGRIDMTAHEGQHPRLGAVDVVPFVPIGETSIEECVELAREFGRRIAEAHELPVYLYARAATRPEREVLADIRRPQFEGLGELIGQPGHEPDFGPSRLHPTAGATVVGARPFLIAYNINLDTRDVELAKRIARRVRERSGGLPRVQALGLYLDDLACAQVSMNLLDHTVTPLWLVWETVGALARAEGVEVRESELIGLCPLAALLEVADHAGADADAADEIRLRHAAEHLRIRDFRPSMALELRLAELAATEAQR